MEVSVLKEFKNKLLDNKSICKSDVISLEELVNDNFITEVFGINGYTSIPTTVNYQPTLDLLSAKIKELDTPRDLYSIYNDYKRDLAHLKEALRALYVAQDKSNAIRRVIFTDKTSYQYDDEGTKLRDLRESDLVDLLYNNFTWLECVCKNSSDDAGIWYTYFNNARQMLGLEGDAIFNNPIDRNPLLLKAIPYITQDENSNIYGGISLSQGYNLAMNMPLTIKLFVEALDKLTEVIPAIEKAVNRANNLVQAIGQGDMANDKMLANPRYVFGELDYFKKDEATLVILNIFSMLTQSK